MERPCWKITRHWIFEFSPFILTLCAVSRAFQAVPSQGAFAMDTGHVSRSRFSGESSPGSPGRVWGRAAGAHTELVLGLVLTAFHGENPLLHVPAGFCFLK